MYICDCHCDTLSKVFEKNGSIYENQYHLDIKRIIANGGGMQFFAIYVPSTYRYHGGIKYTLELIDKYNHDIEILRQNNVDFIKVLSKDDVAQLSKHDVGLLLSIEEGGAIEGSIEALRIFYQLGVRCMTLTWSNRNDIADGVNDIITGGGLTNFGRSVVKEMNHLGMLIDISHIAPQGFWDVIELSTKPIIASHSNASTLCDVKRNLTDSQIKAIAQGNGVIGINFYSSFLEINPEMASLDSIYRHIDYILNLVGEDYIALGSDFDGISKMPQELTGIESMPKIVDYLYSKNYSQTTVEKICFNNVQRILAEVL